MAEMSTQAAWIRFVYISLTNNMLKTKHLYPVNLPWVCKLNWKIKWQGVSQWIVWWPSKVPVGCCEWWCNLLWFPCLANSPGRGSLASVWISLEVTDCPSSNPLNQVVDIETDDVHCLGEAAASPESLAELLTDGLVYSICPKTKRIGGYIYDLSMCAGDVRGRPMVFWPSTNAIGVRSRVRSSNFT